MIWKSRRRQQAATAAQSSDNDQRQPPPPYCSSQADETKDVLNSNYFIWKVTDFTQGPENIHKRASPSMCLCGHKFELLLWPHGARAEDKDYLAYDFLNHSRRAVKCRVAIELMTHSDYEMADFSAAYIAKKLRGETERELEAHKGTFGHWRWKSRETVLDPLGDYVRDDVLLVAVFVEVVPEVAAEHKHAPEQQVMEQQQDADDSNVSRPSKRCKEQKEHKREGQTVGTWPSSQQTERSIVSTMAQRSEPPAAHMGWLMTIFVCLIVVVQVGLTLAWGVLRVFRASPEHGLARTSASELRAKKNEYGKGSFRLSDFLFPLCALAQVALYALAGVEDRMVCILC